MADPTTLDASALADFSDTHVCAVCARYRAFSGTVPGRVGRRPRRRRRQAPPTPPRALHTFTVGGTGLGRLTRRILGLRAVPSGTVLNFRTSAYHKCGAVPRRASI